MTRAQLRLPDPLYQRLKVIAEQQGSSLSEVMRKAAEEFAYRFPQAGKASAPWEFPILDCGGDFLIDPANGEREF